MSVLFKDKVFEELNSSDDGWLTLATGSMINEFEAIVSENDIGEINAEIKQYIKHHIAKSDYVYLHLNKFIKGESAVKLRKMCNKTYHGILQQFYAVTLLDSSIEDANFVTAHVKTHSIEEDKLLKLLEQSTNMSVSSRRTNVSILNRAVVALFDNHEKIRRYTKQGKAHEVSRKIAEVLFDNVWNIKSFELLLKVKNHIHNLINSHDSSVRENAANKIMLMRLRASSGDPIYSLEGF
jgi:hypothetical protein